MSLDVYLVRDDPPPAAEVEAYLGGQPHFQLHGGGEEFQALYENDATGVYFSLDYGAEEEDVELRPSAPVVLALNLNFNRPAFFAHECLDVVGGICRDLGLRTLLDPGETPAEFDFDALLAAWDEGNTFAVRVLAEQGAGTPYMPRDKALAWWRYSRRKPELEERFTSDVFVPTLMLMQDAQTQVVLRVVAWTEGIPLVVPPVDVFVVQKKQGGFLRRKTEQGLVDASVVLDAIGPLLERIDDEVSLLPPAAAESVQDAFNAFPLRELDRDRYEGVAVDGFADVLPEAA